MLKKVLKNKPILLFLAMLLLVAIFFCTNDNDLAQHDISNSSECVQIFSHIIAPSKDNSALKLILVLIFSFILISLFQNKAKIFNKNKKIENFDFHKRWQFLYKLFDKIFQALRRGILNPKIYDLIFTTN